MSVHNLTNRGNWTGQQRSGSGEGSSSLGGLRVQLVLHHDPAEGSAVFGAYDKGQPEGPHINDLGWRQTFLSILKASDAGSPALPLSWRGSQPSLSRALVNSPLKVRLQCIS